MDDGSRRMVVEIVQRTSKPKELVTVVERVRIDNRYLNLPESWDQY